MPKTNQSVSAVQILRATQSEIPERKRHLAHNLGHLAPPSELRSNANCTKIPSELRSGLRANAAYVHDGLY